MSSSSELAAMILAVNDNPKDMWRQGVVTAISGNTVTVRIGTAVTAVAGLRHMDSYVPTVNDVVHLLPYGSTFVVLGKLA